jgi:acyl carrier protein
MSIKEDILIIIRDVLNLDDDVFPEENLKEDLNFEKEQAISCFLKLKEIYPEITITEKDALKFELVDDVIKYFEKQVN